MRLYLALALVASSIAILPTADACAPAMSCIPEEIRVCPAATPWMCAVIEPRDNVENILERIIGPCTCPPIT